MADSTTIDYYRSQMQRRLDRVRRRLTRITEMLQRTDGDLLALEDDIAHVVLELKHVQYLFCRLRRKDGKKDGYDLINRWLTSVSAVENTAWRQIDTLRESETHVKPLSATPKRDLYAFQTVEPQPKVYVWQTTAYVVEAESETGGIDRIPARDFCIYAPAVTERFIKEFHALV